MGGSEPAAAVRTRLLRGRRWGGQALGLSAPKRPPFPDSQPLPPTIPEAADTAHRCIDLCSTEFGGRRGKKRESEGGWRNGRRSDPLAPSRPLNPAEFPIRASTLRTTLPTGQLLARKRPCKCGSTYYAGLGADGWETSELKRELTISPPRFVLSRLLLSPK